VHLGVDPLQHGQRCKHQEEPASAGIEHPQAQRQSGRHSRMSGRKRLEFGTVGLAEGVGIEQRQPAHERGLDITLRKGQAGAAADDRDLDDVGEEAWRGSGDGQRGRDAPRPRIEHHGGEHDQGHRWSPGEHFGHGQTVPQIFWPNVIAHKVSYMRIDHQRQRSGAGEQEGGREEVSCSPGGGRAGNCFAGHASDGGNCLRRKHGMNRQFWAENMGESRWPILARIRNSAKTIFP
jgi:hypothetical protein